MAKFVHTIQNCHTTLDANCLTRLSYTTLWLSDVSDRRSFLPSRDVCRENARHSDLFWAKSVCSNCFENLTGLLKSLKPVQITNEETDWFLNGIRVCSASSFHINAQKTGVLQDFRNPLFNCVMYWGVNINAFAPWTWLRDAWLRWRVLWLQTKCSRTQQCLGKDQVDVSWEWLLIMEMMNFAL
jgi:hypothetical protein